MHFVLSDTHQVRRFLSVFLLPLLLAIPLYSQQVEPDSPAGMESTARQRPAARFVPGRVLVLFDPAADDAGAERIVSLHRGRTVGRDDRIGLRVVELGGGVSETEVLNSIRNAPGVLA